MPTRTYLEQRCPSALRRADPPSGDVAVYEVEECAPSLWRRLYGEVGAQYHWIDRLGWTDDDIRAYLGDPNVTLWLLSVNGGVAGYFELRRHPGESGSGQAFSVEIAYFGLLPAYIGRGLGKYLLTEATARAWDLNPTRVWLHTSTLDHPAALPNYLARGFTVFKTEEYGI